MAMKQQHVYPSDDEIVEGCARLGLARYAASLGIHKESLRGYIKKQGIPACTVAVRKVDPQEVVSREETLEQELRELRAFARRERKDEVRLERASAAIEGALALVPPPKRVGGEKPRHKATDKTPHHRQLTAWSDWHGGEIVDPEAVNGLNEYSWAVMEARVDELITGLLSHKDHSPALSGLDIALVGDMISGGVHGELVATNEFPLAVQAVKMGHLLGQTIERLVPHYLNIRVVSVVGNHPRLVQKPAAKNVHDNLDWVAAMIAKEYLAKFPTVEFSVPTSGAAFHEIASKTFYVWHSDGVRSSMPGIPWGGIMRRVNEIRRSHTGRQIDYWLCGHWHQCNVMADLGIFMNGALKGTDEWVLKMFGGGSTPSQLLLTFSEKHSRLTDARFLTPTAGLPTMVEHV